MIEVQGGHNNWYTFQYQEGTFKMLFDSALAKPMSWDKASTYTAHKIAEKYDNLYLALSGGLDSEYVANVLWRNNIDFTPLIVCLPYSVDHHYAIKWCRDHQVEPEVIELELDDRRLYPEVERLISATGLYSHGCVINSLITNWVMQKGGYLITGEPTLGQRYNHKPITDLLDVWWIEFISQLVFPNYDHPAGFLNYTPEIFLSQALHLDTKLDDVESRAKLHGLPYRAKLSPPMPVLSDRMLHNIISINKLEGTGLTPKDNGGCEWDRTALIEKLQNVQ